MGKDCMRNLWRRHVKRLLISVDLRWVAYAVG